MLSCAIFDYPPSLYSLDQLMGAVCASVELLANLKYEMQDNRFFEGEVRLSMSEINFVNQTVVLAVVLVSMAFRMKGNYLVHGITMIGGSRLGFSSYGFWFSKFL